VATNLFFAVCTLISIKSVFSVMTSASISQAILRLLLALMFFLLPASVDAVQGTASQADDLFPVPPVIKENVRFWKNIYATWSLNTAVIHDSNDLSKIYETITLLDHDLPGAARINRQVLEEARDRIARTLIKLSTGEPGSAEEKKLAALFSGPDRKARMAEASKNIRSQTGLKERFREGVIRSGTYLTEIKRILKSFRLPEELAYLPHVESSFNPRAYSKFGAAGIWQFTRATGRQYMRIDYVLDERLDPIISTRAAAKYLKNSYNTLGDWPLAITSYNYGLAGMTRAKNEKGGFVDIFKSYRKGYFKFAARNFYAEFLAALEVARQLEKELNQSLARAQNNVYLTLPGYVSVSTVSKHFKLTEKEIASLNPALLKPALLGEKLIPAGYSLRLPAGKQTNSRISAIPPSSYHKTQNKSLFHRVRQGETAGGIARRYKVPVDELMRVNNLDRYATIYTKQRLRIPGGKATVAAKNDVLEIKAQYKDKVATPANRLSIPALSPTKKRRPAEDASEFIPRQDPTVYNVFDLRTEDGKKMGNITVQPEETLSLYAEWLDTSISSIASLNGIDAGVPISPGQHLRLAFDNRSPTRFEDSRLDFLQETEEGFFSIYTIVGQKIYLVNDGDTFWDICYNKFDIPLWLLERYNSSVNLEKLSKNQKLIIPLIKQM
jgi:membrane-bound lytic murein transglycosylase D